MSPGSISLMTVVLSEIVQMAVHQEGARNRCTVIVPANLKVTANTPLLVRAISNLVRNGLRYAPLESGPIKVAAGKAGEKVYLSVSDRGPGVPNDVLKQLGEPFYRPDISRSRDSGGFGLGLAIVRRCVEAGGGSVTFSNRDGGGFQATVFLPLSEAVPLA
jgi:two-component system sensor histidine kinase CpxA